MNFKHLYFIILLLAPIFSYGQDTLKIGVSGTCEMCKERIESAAASVIGITSYDYNLEDQQLIVTYQEGMFVEKELHRTLAEAGHDTELLSADDQAYNALPLCCIYREEHMINPDEQKTEQTSIHVSGACGMCRDRIESAALNTQGVISAEYSIDEQLLTVETNQAFTIGFLHRNIADVGHDTDKTKADKKVYEDLPLCCNYRELHSEDGSDDHVLGMVFTSNNKGGREPLIGANVYWIDLSQTSVTDADGSFMLPMEGNHKKLVITYVGYKNDTVMIEHPGHLEIDLNPAVYLDVIEIKSRKRSTEVSYVSPIKVLNIGKRELTKAACCSLSESFQTTPAVDESFTDAVTGTKTIEMLGLASPYIQITRESLPDTRGLSSVFGLDYTPGPWIGGIQLNQGAGSVTNGFESITGQINVDLFHPLSDEKLYLNGFANEGGRYEANLTVNQEVNETFSTALLLHASTRSQIHDRNNDGFLDMPLSDQFIIANRWKYFLENGWEGQFGVKVTTQKLEAGQKSYYENNNKTAWQSLVNTDKYEFWAKSGRLFNENRSTVGLQVAGVYHDLNSAFGNRAYLGTQKTIFVNAIYQTLIGESGTNIKMGATYLMDDINESFNQDSYFRDEHIPGVFAEYTYLKEEKISVVAGLRYDVHNNYGGFITPRAHIRYAPAEQSVFRLAGGRGQKTANIFAENIGAMASSRAFDIQMEDNGNPYGLRPEVAWNIGLSMQQEFSLGSRNASVGIDFYRTIFENQVVIDFDESFDALHIYNLDGSSYSNSLQFLLEAEIVDRLDLRLAYRLNDVQVDYQSGRKQKPLIAKHRAFANIAYATENGWAFDYTANRIGGQRIPGTRLEEETYSPAYFLSNMQVSKLWNNTFELYLGADNVFNYQQKNPIRSADNPFGNDFDASLVWGPIFGRTIYTGFRYKIFNE